MSKTTSLSQLSLVCLLAMPISAVAGGPDDAAGLDRGAPKPVTAISADRFLSSLGVNTHVDQGYDPKTYIAPLRYLGVRVVRDGIRHVDGDILIARATGVRFAITGGGDLDGELASARMLAHADALLALEGPNEPNNFPITFSGAQGGGRDGGSWKPVAAFQAALYHAVQHDPVLAHYPVFGPSETGAETENVGLQFRTTPQGFDGAAAAGTTYSDFLNIHNYVSGVHGGYGDNQAWQAADPVLDGRWDGLYGNSGSTWRRHFRGYDTAGLIEQPRVTTETGWDSVSDPGGEAVQAAVLTNTYLAQFKRGWRYTFIYELKDEEGGPGHQGLFAGDRPKLAARYIHAMTTILADHATSARPGHLAFGITTGARTVHDLLLQKSDGSFDLVIWNEQSRGRTDVTVTFATPQPSVEIFDIARGTAPVNSLRDTKELNLTLTDHAMILRVVPHLSAAKP